MNYIDLPDQPLDPARYNVVVEGKGTHAAQKFVWDTQLTPGKGWANPHTCGQWLVKDTGKNQHMCTRSRKSINLLPGGIADPASPYFMRETVQYSDTFIFGHHRPTFLSFLLTSLKHYIHNRIGIR